MTIKYCALQTVLNTPAIILTGILMFANVVAPSTSVTFNSGTTKCPIDQNGYCAGPALPFRLRGAITPPQSAAEGSSQAKPKFTPSGSRARFFRPAGVASAKATVPYSYVATSLRASTPTVTPSPTNPMTTHIANPVPSRVLHLNNWLLTLPVGSPVATMVEQPKLGGYSSKYFFTNGAGNGVVFHAPVSGSTTSGSAHTRSELRETTSSGSLPWGWSAGRGTHILSATQAITHLPGGNGTLGFAQIHGPGTIWYLILDAVGTGNGTAKLVLKDSTGKANGAVIASHYTLGMRFNLTISATNGVVGIDFNNIRKVTTRSTKADCYFKIGAYNQSIGDFGQSVVYNLSATHR